MSNDLRILTPEDDPHDASLKATKLAENLRLAQARRAAFRDDIRAALSEPGNSLQSVLRSWAEAITRHLGATALRIWTHDSDRGALELQTSAGSPSPVGEAIVGLIAQQRQAVVVSDLASDARLKEERATGAVAFAGYPLIVEDRLVGVITLLSDKPFADDTLDSLASVLDAIAQSVERKRAEEMVGELRLEYESLVDSIDGIVWEANPDTMQFEVVSKQAERLLGYPMERWTSELDFWKQHLYDEDRDWAVAYRADATGKRRNHELEYRMVAAHGNVLWIRDFCTVVAGAGRGSMRGVMVDITERKGAEEAMRRSADRYRDLFENANDIIYTLDLNGAFTSVNRKMEQLTSYGRADVLGMNVVQLVAPEYSEPVGRRVLAARAGECPSAPYEVELICKDGRRLPLEVSTRLVFEADVPAGIQCIARDISERKHAESERRRLESQLIQAQKMESIGRLAGGVAHDFNNLLTAIIGYAQLVQSRLSPGDPMHRELNEILRAGQRAGSLTGQLLAFSRQQKLERKSVNINDTIRNLARMLRRIIGEDVEVVLDLSSDLPWTFADAAQIEQVIMNLAVNSRDAMPRGGRILIATLVVSLDDSYCREHGWARPGEYVRISVTDVGEGMDEETLGRIFEPFFTTKAKGKGTGLGLSTVYGIVAQHEGLVHVESQPGSGTTFHIFTPVESVDAHEDALAARDDLRGGNETILIAEDEEGLQALIAEVLSGLGYRLLQVGDGEEAIRAFKARRDQIDLVMLDVVMPVTGGREVYERIRALGSNVPVLFMTGYGPDISAAGTTDDLNVPVVRKPYSIGDLTRKVRELLDGKTAAHSRSV